MFLVTVYQSGYLPETEPGRFEDLTDAVASWRAEAQNTVDNADDNEIYRIASERLKGYSDEAVIEAVERNGFFSTVLNGFVHTVELEPGAKV